MKPRKVSITLEVETTLPIKTLRNKAWWREGMGSFNEEGNFSEEHIVNQVQVNVIKPSK